MSDGVVESTPRSTRRKSDDKSTPKKKKSKKRRRRSGGVSSSTQDRGLDSVPASVSSLTDGAIPVAEAETGVSSVNGSPAESDTLVETKEKVCPIISYVTALFHTVF